MVQDITEVDNILGDKKDILLSFFHDKEIFNKIYEAFNEELILIKDELKKLYESKLIETAQGFSLDIIGKIVGQERKGLGEGKEWLGEEQSKMNFSPFFVGGASDFGFTVSDDSLYKRLIEGKILKNHTKYASIPEIIDFVKKVFNIDIAIENINAFEFTIFVPSGTSERTKSNLKLSTTGEGIYNKYFLPIKPTVKIIDVVEI